MKDSESGGLEKTVERDNTASFSKCSRQILDLLCEINGVSHYTDEAWEELQTALVKAQYVRKDIPEQLAESFGQTFPDIGFTYDKNNRLSIKLRVQGNLCACAEEDVCQSEELQSINTGLAGFAAQALQQEISQEALEDAFSLQSNSRRSVYSTFLEEPSDEFFQYNELAYERVMQVTGQYVSEGTKDNFREICLQDIQTMNGAGQD